ncbi:MAG TPA: efflux RND transporter periplasmic adaptor subunit [Vicinamibacterales bacterium]|nr:efflux RND transporter periplasmic adaptor subunit [Vicinamibacterales bacterium]
MSAKNILIAAAVVLLGGAVVGANLYFKRDKGALVTTEVVKARDLEAIVSASGKIQPKRSVNVSSDTVGRVVNLAVNEGDRVAKGQFLLQIDPKPARSRVDSGVASLKAAEASLDQMRQAVETGKAQLELARQTLVRQQDLWKQQLNTKETLDKAVNDVKVAESSLSEREKTATAQDSRIAQEQAGLDSARYDLSKVRIESPIDGIVTHRSIEEGEMVVVGTMNNAGTVLMTLADMSFIQAEIEVDETNVPSVQIGQRAKITVDAIPDRSFRGHVTEIGNSPIQQSSTTGTTAATGTQATNFKVVVVLDEPIPEVRPGFTCTADITTATRQNVLSVPIPAVAVRELVYDANGQVVKEPRTDRRRRTTSGSVVDPVASAQELEPGQTRKETEGVFIFRDGHADFVPIKMGIAGERYFELVGGLQAGDQVVTGPYNSVRGMADGDPVRVDIKKRAR